MRSFSNWRPKPMNTFFNPFPTHNSRIGFHYYPDTLHYREADLQTWLPEFSALGVSWLVLKSDANRAIPEAFLRALIQNGIEPVVQFDLSLNAHPTPADLSPILEAYGHWGVKAVLLFDRPNSRSSWTTTIWAQNNLVEHFLDRYLPLAQAADQAGIIPILPPLQPAGAYWDTAFLRSVLENMSRRKQSALLDHLVLSCYAWTNQHALNWGTGGPQRWSSARPYATPQDSQDQNGFRVFEWYQSVAASVLIREVPVLLLQAGTTSDPHSPSTITPPHDQLEIQAIAQTLYGDSVVDPAGEDPLVTPIPQSVLAGFFYLLASDSQSPDATHAWFQVDGTTCAAVEALKSLASSPRFQPKGGAAESSDSQHPIQHYLLLPAFDWGVADWHLDMVRPLIKKYRPTVGFSMREAALAKEVTVIGNASAYPEEALDQLRLSGSTVRRMDGIGIEIATQLAER